VERAREANALFTNKALLPREVIAQLPSLQYIGVLATGCNVVDLEAAADRGIPVCNAAGYSAPSVAQMVFAYILEFANRASLHSAGVHSGKWSRSEDFCYWETPQQELADKTLGILGLGDIGSRVASIAHAFGMRVIAYTRHPERQPPDGVSWVSMEDLFRESDYLSLHCPLTPDTERLVNAQRLSWMKPGAVLINTGRGALVDEAALAGALASGQLGGAGVDVMEKEPPDYPSPLFGVRTCLITPHMAWATKASRQRLLEITVDNLRAFLEGTPVNKVN